MWDDRSRHYQEPPDLPTILDALRRLGGPSRDGEWGCWRLLSTSPGRTPAISGAFWRCRGGGLNRRLLQCRPKHWWSASEPGDEFLTSRAKLMEFVGSLKDEDWEKVYITPRGEERTVRETPECSSITTETILSKPLEQLRFHNLLEALRRS